MESTPVVCPCCGIVSLTCEPQTHTCCHCDTDFPVASRPAQRR